MKSVGSLVLLVSIGLLLVVAVMGVSDMSTQASTSTASNVVGQVGSADSVISPVILLIGFLTLIVGATIAIDAFR
jgi:hypothetical protein